MKTGLETLLQSPLPELSTQRVGLVANPTTISRQVAHGIDLINAHPDINLVQLYGPEHGIRATAQDQIGVDSTEDPVTGLPEFSLYGASYDSLSPSPESLEQIDTLLFDIQDIGSRYYTYQATMAAVEDVKVSPTPSAAIRWRGEGF